MCHTRTLYDYLHSLKCAMPKSTAGDETIHSPSTLQSIGTNVPIAAGLNHDKNTVSNRLCQRTTVLM